MADVRQILPASPEHGTEEPREGSGSNRQHTVSNENRWSRTSLKFKDLTPDAWCELSFQLSWHPEEKSRAAHDFAMVGVDFLTEDGSSIDFAQVPGLTRAQIEPQSCYVAGPDYHDRSSDDVHTGKVHCTFLVPSPAKHITVTFRSWRNSHPFTIVDPKVSQIGRGAGDDAQAVAASKPPFPSITDPSRSWPRLTSEPLWFSYGVMPSRTLFVRGQLINRNAKSDVSLARVVFRNKHGEIVSPPDDIPVSPVVGAYIDIPVHRQTRRFTLELTPPDQAVTVDLGFQAGRDEAEIDLVTPLETSLSDDLLLENILSEELPDAVDFAREALKRLQPASRAVNNTVDASLIDNLIDRQSLTAESTIHDTLIAIQQGPSTALANNQLTLGTSEGWPLPQAPEWTEDPYRSPAWRLEYQSLSWLLDLAQDQDGSGIGRAMDLAISWSLGNPWGRPRDPLSAYPASAAIRTEVLLRLLAITASSKKKKPDKQRVLASEIIRHGFSLAEILSQNIFLHSHLQIRIACALLSVSRGFPDFTASGYWKSIALAQLHSGFDHLLGPGGSSSEQSPYYRLELISIGVILSQHLRELPEADALRGLLDARLKDSLRIIVSATDPAGMLPPFGDTPRRHHHASWLRRLLSGYGRHLLSDRSLAEELAYPLGSRAVVSDHAGLAAFRHYAQKPDWSYLCASTGEQRHENGHYDCTSFVYTARGVKWITDPGGSGGVEAGPARHYLLSSRAHNVAIPDAREQSAGLGWVEANVTLERAHAVRIGTNVYGPGYAHARIIICLDDLNAVAVFDRFDTSRESVGFEATLHFEENIAVALANPRLAIGFHKRERLRIIPHPVAGQLTGLSVWNGHHSRAGSLQGYLAGGAGGLRPANVLNYGFTGGSKVCGGVVLTTGEESLRRILDLVASQKVRELLE